MYSLQQSFSYFARSIRYWRDQGRQYQGGLWWNFPGDKLGQPRFSLHGRRLRTWRRGQNHLAPARGDAEFVGWLDRGRHLLREAFRRQQFQAFLDKDRRDSRQLRNAAVYEEERVARARTLYRKTRHAGRAVLLGAAWSTLCYSRARGLVDEPICRWCHLQGASHMASSCVGM